MQTNRPVSFKSKLNDIMQRCNYTNLVNKLKQLLTDQIQTNIDRPQQITLREPKIHLEHS